MNLRGVNGGLFALALWLATGPGGCTAQSSIGDASAQGKDSSPYNSGGNTGVGTGGAGGRGGSGGGGSGSSGGAGGAVPGSGGVNAWATWPMPNQPGTQLPNPQHYTVMPGTAPNMAGDVVRDDVTGLFWQRRASDERLAWQGAMDYCRSLVLAGWDDWRLPSRIELVSLLDLSQTNPSINREAFPDIKGEWFWTSSLQADDPERSWFVYFYFGYPDTDPQINTNQARCVR